MKKFDPKNPLKYKIIWLEDCLVEVRYGKRLIGSFVLNNAELKKVFKYVGTAYNVLSMMRRLIEPKMMMVIRKDLNLEIWDDIVIDCGREVLNAKK